MQERRGSGVPEGDTKREQKEGQSEYAFSLYSDFSVPELGESKPLGRILDEEVYISYDKEPDSPNSLPSYWIGNNETAGWRSIKKAEPRTIWETFKDIAKDAIFWDAMNKMRWRSSYRSLVPAQCEWSRARV